MAHPRNPRHFPRMKVRGARRRRDAPHQRMLRSFDQLNAAVRLASLSFAEFTVTLGRLR